MVTDDQLARELRNAITEERGRIARELHDGVAQQLALALMQLEYLQRLLENEAGQFQNNLRQSILTGIHKTSVIIQNGLLELRHCISSSVPLPLTQRDFTLAVQDLLDSYRNEGWQICYCNDEQVRVPTEWEIPVYRFLQEALINIHKHAHASHVIIHFRIFSDTLSIAVSDDGCGFPFISADTSPLEEDGQHFGLRLMRERIEHLGGRWQLWSQPGWGTTIQICFPLSN
jgi:signal transduction histidine kinase